MDKVKDALLTLKDELYKEYSDRHDEDFVKLVKLRDIDDDLYETLILIHSNYKAEFTTLKSTQVRTVSKIIDTNIDILYLYKDIMDDLRKEIGKKKQPLITIKTTAYGLGAVIIFLGGLMLLFTHNESAARFAVDALKSLLICGNSVN